MPEAVKETTTGIALAGMDDEDGNQVRFRGSRRAIFTRHECLRMSARVNVNVGNGCTHTRASPTCACNGIDVSLYSYLFYLYLNSFYLHLYLFYLSLYLFHLYLY